METHSRKNTIVFNAGGVERNLGIDALRIFAMLLIVVLHVYNRGGAASLLVNPGSWSYRINFPLRTVCMGTVDLYALISGYVMVSGRFRPARYLELWLQVVVLGLAECLVWMAVVPGMPTAATWRMTLLPVTAHEFWYFTAYTVVFALSPLVNRGLRALNGPQTRALMLGLFLLFSVGWLLGKLLYGDTFYLSSGYSPLWLLVLYILGAGMKRTGFLSNTPAWKLWLGIICCLGLMYGLKWLLYQQTLPEEVRDWRSLVDAYTSPFILVMSLCIFALFARLQIRGAAARLVKFFSPLTFGVYVLHVHDGGWALLHNAFQPFIALPGFALVMAVLAVGTGIFLGCSLIDWLRSLLFRLLRVRKLLDGIEHKLKSLWQAAE